MERPIVAETLTQAQIASYVQIRQTFLLAQFQPDVAKANGITYWEQLTCVGFNPDISRLEAVVQIKQPTGYSGNLCSAGSHEFVRFFVDYHDGAGFIDAGVANFKVADIPNAAPATHPLSYMAYVFLNDEAHRKFTSCDVAVLPTVRAVLSWNSIPSVNPNATPHFGNVLNADIQLKRKPIILAGDLLHTLATANKLTAITAIPSINKATAIPVIPDPLPPVETFYKAYQAAGVPDQRTFYTSIVPQLSGVSAVAAGTHSYAISDITKLGINIGSLSQLIIKPPVLVDTSKADVSFEELTCVGLNTATDTLGAVIKLKKSAGFSGNLCTAGSKEYVAFWADWNNDGSYDQYLGTTSVNVHDITGIPAGGLFYNVALQVDVTKFLKDCSTPTVVKIRAVLSWQSLPSTTNPNALNYYGNRVDALVQIRPGSNNNGQIGLNLFDVSGVAVSSIEQVNATTKGLAYPTGVYPSAALPFGGIVKLSGLFTNSGASGSTFYKVQFSDNNGVSWQDILDKQNFQIIESSVQTVVPQDPSLTGGWFTYLPAVPTKAEKLSLLALWNSSTRNGLHKLRVVYTKDPAHVANINYSAEIFVMLDNTNYNVVYDPTVIGLNPAATLDINIDSGDCKFYKKGDIISGQIKATDQYFNGWSLDLQPAQHIIPLGTPLSTFITPVSRTCTGFADHGDTSIAFTINTAYLQSCGYTVRLGATDRALIGYTYSFLDGSYLFSLTSHYNEKYVGFAVLP